MKMFNHTFYSSDEKTVCKIWLIVILFIICGFLLVGCNNENETVVNNQQIEECTPTNIPIVDTINTSDSTEISDNIGKLIKIKSVNFDARMDQYIVYDSETKVMYVIIDHWYTDGGFSISPLYNPDGSLRVYDPNT